METPQKRQKSWFSSLTGLVSGGRGPAREAASTATPSAAAKTGASLANGDRAASRPRLPRSDEQTPARYSGTFSAPPVESPESPAKRASPTQLAQRKIHNRVKGPSGRLASSSASNLASSAAPNAYAYNTNLYSSSSLGRANTLTPRRTNFSSATTPRNMFRDSVAREMPAFTFTPRVPANTLRGSFPATTPGRSLRAPGAELGARDMAKIAPSELFHMKIPDPDPKLSGEAINNLVPDELKHKAGSLYASQYLAHLCPPDFDEEQRNQFFCILDLRRLKYAADDVFVKKDWKLNISNFAKEYEKNRSLIMLRYGLYEFKTVKVSKDVFAKWKTAHNIPDEDDGDGNGNDNDNDAAPGSPAAAPKALKQASSLFAKPNGTEGLLRSGKRKAQDDIDPSAASSSSSASQPTSKRSRALDGAAKAAERATEREPLAETSTPTLNKSKRKATRSEGADQLQRAKMQKPTPSGTPSATPSATKAFFEKVANSPAKEKEAAATVPATVSASASTPSIHVSKPSLSDAGSTASASKPSLFKSSTLGQLPKPSTNGSSGGGSSLARSVLESGLKANAAQNNNIFGYLSDASSAKGSGNDNADADGEDTDDSEGQEESEAAREGSDSQSASVGGSAGASTPQPSASLFSAKPNSLFANSGAAANGSTASSEASDAAPGRSLFDRVNKGSDGQPIRLFGSDAPSAFPTSSTPLFGSKPASEAANSDKEPAPSSANKTWTPDSPIKFASGSSSTPAKSLFGSAPSSFSAAATTPAASSPFKFGPAAATAPATATPESSTTGKPAAEKPAAAEPTAPAETAKDTTAIAPAAAGGSSTAAPLFGFLNKPAESAPSTTTTATSLFGAPSTQPPASTAPTASAASLFGTPRTAAPAAASLFGQAPASSSSSAVTAAPAAFGASSGTPALQSQTLFGKAPTGETPSFGQKRSADDDAAATPKATPSFGSGTSTLFGNPTKSNGSSGGDEPPAKKTASLFGASLGGAGASSAPSAPLFSFGAPKQNGDAGKLVDSAAAKAQETKSLFGSNPAASAPEPPKAGLFGNATPAPASSTPLFSFGGATTSTPAAQPSGGLFSFGSTNTQTQQSTAPAQAPTPSFGGGNGASGGGSSFTFSVGGGDGPSQPFRNPFAAGDSSAAQAAPSLSFGGAAANGQSGAPAPSLFQFGGGGGGGSTAAAPAASTGALFSFGGSQSTEAVSTPGNSFSNAAPAASNGIGSSSVFSFGATASQPTGTPLFGQQAPAAGASLFNLAPPVAGASSGTNTPFTNLGGASSLATTPATGTPEPGATQDNTDTSGHQADGDEAPQEQISLTEGGPGEEDEAVVHEVRAKALRLATKDESESESPAPQAKKSPWKTEGVGPLRVLRNKATGAVRLLLRAEPRGHLALNRALLPDFTYKPEPNAKYVKLTTANESGSGLETWMLQVKTKEAAQKLADVLEENKAANKK